MSQPSPPNDRLQRTALRAAAEPERSTDTGVFGAAKEGLPSRTER